MGDEDGGGIGVGSYTAALIGGRGCGDGDLEGNKSAFENGTGDGYEGDWSGNNKAIRAQRGYGDFY